MLFQYLPEIPSPPKQYLYSSLEQIRFNTTESMFFPGIYGSFRLGDSVDLEGFFKPYFSFDTQGRFGYQYIGENILTHKDVGRVETYNFILDTGGDDVTTVWYDDDKTTVIHEEVIKPMVWHKIRVDKYHTVTNITRPRIMMMVFEEVEIEQNK